MSDMRERILELLREARGEYLSGQAISERLGISRAAVWKHVEILRRQGIAVDAATHKGYRLQDIPSPSPLRPQQLSLHTRSLGRQIAALPEVDSTNAFARALAREGCPSGLLITAETQSAGRGRRGRSWINAPGQDICMSLVLRPAIETQHAPRFTIATALGVYRLLTGLGLPGVGIKWPNDILVNGAKVCGILLEMEGNLDQLEAVIVGLGLNVNTESFPPDIPAASLSILLGRKLDRSAVLSQLLNHLEPLYEACENTEGFAEILSEYRIHCCTLHRQVRVEAINETFAGTAVDVDALGRLLVQDADGLLRTVGAGDVSIR